MMSLRLRREQVGISLLEILIALSLGAFMLVGIISLMASVSATRTELARSSEQIENGRYAVQIITDDVSMAGYFGPYFRLNPNRSIPDPCDDDSTLSDLGFAYAVNPTLPTAIAGVASGTAVPTCITNPRYAAGTTTVNAEVLIVRHASPAPTPIGSAVDGVPYMQVSLCDDEDDFKFSNVVSDLDLTGKDCSTVQPVWSYESRAYYVARCDDCSNGGDGIPTLKMVEFANGAIGNAVSLVEGVEDMHVEYGMDLDASADGVPDCFVDDPTVNTAPAGCAVTAAWSADDATNWSNVVAVDVWFLVRSPEEYANWNDTRTYDLGRASRSGPFNDGFKRKVLKASIMLQNVSGPRG